MSDIKNIPGEFEIKLTVGGVVDTRVMKCNFAAIERIETKLLGKSIAETLQEAINGRVYISDLVSVIHAGLEANNDRRLTRAQVGDALYAGEPGPLDATAIYIEYLTYALFGGAQKKGGVTGEDQSRGI